MEIGDLTKRASFQRRTVDDDGYGNEIGAWSPTLFIRWCHVRFLRGGEAVMGSRLEGRQPVIVTVRNDSDTATVNSDMRCIIDGRPYNIREFPRPSDDRQFLEFLAESGVGDG